MKILYVTTISNTVNAFLIPHIKMLTDEGYKVDIACNIEQEIKAEIYDMGCKVHQLPLQRFPISKNNIKAYKMLKDIVVIEGYDLVHTHTPIASAVVRLTCRKLKNVEVFYTAHGFHFYKGAPLINWFAYYPVEKLLARYTDALITINREDYERAKREFKAKRVEYVPGVGVDVLKYSSLEVDKALHRKEIGVPYECFVLLSVGELNRNKNHEVVIKALSEIECNNIHYVICGAGPLESYLMNLAKELGIENRVHFLGFRNDIPEICKVTDVFIFPSLREGLPVALMEAMVSVLPIICSNIRGNSDLVEDGKGGFLVDPKNVEGFVKAIDSLMKNEKLRSAFGKHNFVRIKEYSIENIISHMKRIYSKEIEKLGGNYEGSSFNK